MRGAWSASPNPIKTKAVQRAKTSQVSGRTESCPDSRQTATSRPSAPHHAPPAHHGGPLPRPPVVSRRPGPPGPPRRLLPHCGCGGDRAQFQHRVHVRRRELLAGIRIPAGRDGEHRRTTARHDRRRQRHRGRGRPRRQPGQAPHALNGRCASTTGSNGEDQTDRRRRRREEEKESAGGVDLGLSPAGSCMHALPARAAVPDCTVHSVKVPRSCSAKEAAVGDLPCNPAMDFVLLLPELSTHSLLSSLLRLSFTRDSTLVAPFGSLLSRVSDASI
jgi:hypothetical protein